MQKTVAQTSVFISSRPCFFFVCRQRKKVVGGWIGPLARGCLFDLRLKIERLRVFSARTPLSIRVSENKARDRDYSPNNSDALRHGFNQHSIMYSEI